MGLFDKFRKAKQAPENQQKPMTDIPAINIIGVYNVPMEPDVRLVEICVACPPTQLDVGKFTQREDGVKESNWQAAYNEHYLNENGTEVIGKFGVAPTDAASTRLVFFLYFLNINEPLLSQFGELPLPSETQLPQRLESIIDFEAAD